MKLGLINSHLALATSLEAIKRLGIDDATISLELEYPPDPEHIVEWVAEAYDKTAALLRGRTATMSRMSRRLAVLALLGSLVVLVGWPLAATVLEACRAPQRLDRALTSLGLDDWALRIRRVWNIEPESATGSVLDPAATARLLRETWGLARPARLAVETLSLVFMTAALVLPPGILLALLLFRTDTWGRGLLLGILGIAAFVPLPLHATAWLGALGNAGRMQAIGLRPVLVGRTGAAIIHALACLPWVVFLVGVGLRTIEPELEESAELDMPAGRVWGKVTLRRGVGAIAAAAVAVAVLTAGDMTVTDLLQVRTYAEEAYVQFTLGRGPADAALVSVPPLIILGGSIVLVARSLVHADPARLASAFAPARLWKLGRWRVAAGASLLLLVGNLVALPLYSLVCAPAEWGGGPGSVNRRPGRSRACWERSASPPPRAGSRSRPACCWQPARRRSRPSWPGSWPGSAGTLSPGRFCCWRRSP